MKKSNLKKTAPKKNRVVAKVKPNKGLVASDKPTPKKVYLSSDNREIILDFDRNIGKAKLELANIEIQLQALMSQRQQVGQKLFEANTEYFNRVNKMAIDLGLDMKAKEWNFNIDEMSFTDVTK
jgi:hypothetical protein